MNADEAVCAVVLDGALHAGFHGQLFGGEQLFALDASVHNPLIKVSRLTCVGDWHGLEVVIVFERGVEISLPVELIDDEVDVLVALLWHVLDQEFPWNGATFDEVLVHPENVTSPLWFVGAKRAGGVEHAGGNEPPGARLQTVGAGQVEDSVVTFVPVFDAAAYLFTRCAGFESHEGVREVVPDVVVLRREIVGFRFTFLSHEFGLLRVLVHVVGNRAHVVEELRVHRPLAVLVPNRGSDEICTTLRDSLLEGETVFSNDDVRETFVGSAVIVCGGRGRGEPTLIDTAAVESECIEIVWMQFEAFAGLKE